MRLTGIPRSDANILEGGMCAVVSVGPWLLATKKRELAACVNGGKADCLLAAVLHVTAIVV